MTFTVSAQAIILYNEFENYTFKLLPQFPGANELIDWPLMRPYAVWVWLSLGHLIFHGMLPDGSKPLSQTKLTHQ